MPDSGKLLIFHSAQTNIPMPEIKMSAEEVASYYLRVHQEALKRDKCDRLGAVIGPDANPWVNRSTDFAHRLGMKNIFRILESQWGSLSHRSVLDLGCGRGRWSKEYARRGAELTGVDISAEAVSLLADEMPKHHFISQDITSLSFPDESFDIVNSVTVLQHMPDWKQRVALTLLSRWLKRGGYVVLLENVLAFDAPHVFPHRANEWIEMVEATGLKCVYRRGCNFEILFRIEGRMLRALRRGRLSKGTALPSVSGTGISSFKSRTKSAATSALALASFPVEWACQWLPLASPTHSVMIFEKPA
jgi:SAM-dependent methyltransferase